MSYSYEATGYFMAQRDAEGQFNAGELLPITLTEQEERTIEAMNAGAAEVVGEALALSRVMIGNDRFGDSDDDRFKILINGHVQNPDDPNSSKSYCQIRIETL